MSRKITPKQKGFVKTYLETGNGSFAAKENYDVTSDESARAIASQNLTKPNVIEYLESKASRASEIVFEIAEAGEMDNVRLSAAKDILDRAGYKAIEKSLTINVNIEEERNTLKLLIDSIKK